MRRRRRESTETAGRFERMLLSVMGPPDVGDVNAPVTLPADPAAALCHRCGQAWERHEIVRTSGAQYANCPVEQED